MVEEIWWKSSLILPLVIAVSSAAILVVQSIARNRYKPKNDASKPLAKPFEDGETRRNDLQSNFRRYSDSQGGLTILTFKIARLLGCLTLLALSTLGGSQDSWLRAAIATTYGYTSLLATASLFPTQWSPTLTRHCIVVLLTSFGVYAYRDIWPLATYTDAPLDASEGYLLWVKLGILTLTAVGIPLFIPRQYTPLDPTTTETEPNPEQTASLFSFMVYSFLDPIIFEASRVPHLPYERLPPLADYDRAGYLTDLFGCLPWRAEATFVLRLDEGVLYVLKPDFPGFFTLLMRTVSPWLSLGIHGDGAHNHPPHNPLLRLSRSPKPDPRVRPPFPFPFAPSFHVQTSKKPNLIPETPHRSLESEGAQDHIRPWLWLAALFLGPMLMSLSFQAYVYLGTMAL
ncbi:hypothetical protein CVT26_006770, partial [Gymnopilus dilepis]